MAPRTVTESLACDDGDRCTQVDTCLAGACVGEDEVTCEALDGCHLPGVCNPNSGDCTEPQPPDGTSCNDADACTSNDRYAAGRCGGTNVVCQDDNPCTSDGCNATAGCVYVPVMGTPSCDDGNACTSGEVCSGGACGGGTVVACDDDEVCTRDACDTRLGCTHAPVRDGTQCDDDDVCSNSSACAAGRCQGAFFEACDDGNPCTADGCDPDDGCVYRSVADGIACDDGDLCSAATRCFGGACAGGTVVGCADDNVCTDDACDPEVGCVHLPSADGGVCDDGLVWTTASECIAGQCRGAAFLNCDDGNPCTDDTIDPALGCVFSNVLDGTDCDDGALCTLRDRCLAGSCAGEPVVCGEPGECELAGTCNAATGNCDYPAKPGDVPLPLSLVDLAPASVASAALALSDTGLAAGWVAVGGEHHAAIWDEDGVMTDLGPGEAVGVNDAGEALVGAPHRRWCGSRTDRPPWWRRRARTGAASATWRSSPSTRSAATSAAARCPTDRCAPSPGVWRPIRRSSNRWAPSRAHRLR